jgi:signal transduction histidine kinase
MRSEAGGRGAADAATVPADLPVQVLDALELGVVALDRERKVAYANRSFEEFLEVEPGALLGTPGAKVFPGAEARWLKGSTRGTRDFRIETEGRQLTLSAEAFPRLDGAGELAGSVVLAEAVSETEAGEFRKKIDRLVSLGELSAYVAHEIRNPLTGIRTTVQFVTSKLDDGDSRREDLQDVINELDRVEQIITGLLLFASPPTASPQPLDLHQVLDKTLGTLEARIEDANVVLIREYTDDLPPVYADPDLTQQVFLNLCLNAVQAMPEGGELKVTTGVRRYRTRRSRVDVAVSDTGVGIPKDLMERIFDPFFTTRSMGTGLGLSISAQIVQDANGVLTAKNNHGGGATLRVAFPEFAERPSKADDESADARRDKTDKPEMATTAQGSGQGRST